MGIKYYTHFVTDGQPLLLSEFTGVVELNRPPRSSSNAKANEKEIAAILARTLHIDSDDIRILHWSRLH